MTIPQRLEREKWKYFIEGFYTIYRELQNHLNVVHKLKMYTISP